MLRSYVSPKQEDPHLESKESYNQLMYNLDNKDAASQDKSLQLINNVSLRINEEFDPAKYANDYYPQEQE